MSSRIMSQRYTKQESDCLFSIFNLYCYKTRDYPTLCSVVSFASSLTSGGVDYVFLLRASVLWIRINGYCHICCVQ